MEKYLSILCKVKPFYRLGVACFLSFAANVMASNSLGYTGRLVNSNGSPVTGPVDLKLDLAYLNPSQVAGPVICSKELSDVPLSNGVFHIKIDYSLSDCGGKHIIDVLSDVLDNESVAIRVTDMTNALAPKAYSFNTIHALPFATVSSLSKTLVAPPAGTPSGHVLEWNGTNWVASPPTSGGGDGSVTEIQTGSGLSGGPITNSGTISIANLGVGSGHIANGAITNGKVASNAGIERSKLAPGSPNTIVVNDLTGAMSAASSLPVSLGGTGATTAAEALTNLGIVVGLLPGNILGASSVPICNSTTQKLLWGPGGWLCATDKDTLTDTTKLSLTGGTLTGSIDLSGNKITGVGAPSAGTDAATKSYVDGLSHWDLLSGNVYRDTGRVGIGTDSPLGVLDITSTSSGILIPRMTTVERDGISPVSVGMQIYNISTNELNFYNGTEWKALGVSGAGITSLVAGTGLSGGTISTSGTIAIAPGGVSSTELANGSVTNDKVSVGAAIDRSKLATGTANHILVNNASGVMSSVATLPVLLGGTGALTAADARTNLELGSAAVANIGTAAGNVMAANAVPNCDADEKLSMSASAPYTWSCIPDADTTLDNTKLSLSGGTLEGVIDMDGNKIIGVGTPTTGSDAATKSYVDGLSHWKELSGNIFRDAGRVGIGTDSPLGVLDITSTSSGILIPRMTTGQRDGISPVSVGMQIYNISTNELNYFNGTEWKALGVSGAGITSLTAGTGLSGGTISTSGTIGIAPGGVSATELASDSVTNDKVSASAAIERSKLASGSANHVLVNNASGVMSSVATLPVSQGGTGIDTLVPGRLYISSGTGSALEILNCGPLTYLTFGADQKPTCSILPVAASGVAGIVSNSAQTFSGLKTFENGIKVGTISTVCDSTMEGAIRYESTSKSMEFCNGTVWASTSGN